MGFTEGLVTGLIVGVGGAYIMGYIRYRQWKKGTYNPWK